ncbi:MAG: hypothetical protein GVY11_06100 [Gammaproteobacteria bacterium]|jgi:hypothetical protein|nr:hypothetical protein [Gammaproteobacteria bacterium]
MKPDSDAMRLLIERLLGDGGAWFTAADLDAVLSWLAGSERHGGGALATRIGTASEQTGRRIAVYDRLSAQLFRDGQLDLAGAHVDIDVDHETRRGRYRRLMNAFHPDRFPQHADWLTSRSQAVLASYARFRKGEAPEHRSPDERPARHPRKATARRPERPEWPRERRSARLTPMRGPGPLTQLRTWLLGIKNLQQRVLVGLGVLCLIPVIYAYVAYKPYRDMSSLEPAAVVREEPRDRQAAPVADEVPEGVPDEVVAQATAPPSDEPSVEQKPETAETGRRPDPTDDRASEVTADTGPVLAWSAAEEPAPVLPSWQEAQESSQGRAKTTEAAAEAAPGEAEEAQTRESIAAAAPPDPAPAEAGEAVGSDWMNEMADAAGQTLAAVTELITVEAPAPSPAEVDEAGRAETEPARETDPAPPAEVRIAEALADRGPAPAANDESPRAEGTSRPQGAEASTAAESADAPADRPNRAGNASQLAAATNETPANEPAPDRSGDAAESTAPEPAAQPAVAEAASGDAEAAGETSSEAPALAASEPAAAEAGAQVAEAAVEDPRQHIEELLAGYRTSFENGWLDEFLDHFTADPRENTHRGRGWFRSNYGWLFDNTAERRLDIDILNISRGDDHWVALARFEMQVDYPDRPATRSTRQVRYTIEANEHDQLRIAAIEY